MSSVSDSRWYALDAQATGDAIVSLGQSNGLHLKTRSAFYIEMGGGMSLFGWPATVAARLTASGNKTAVNYEVTNFGFGPLQSGHCKKVLKKVTDALASREAK